MTTTPRRLTAIQFDTLAFMVSFEAEHRRPASHREIADHFGVTPATPYYHVLRLAERGCCTPEGAVTDHGRAVVAAGKDAATAVRAELPEVPRELPADVPVGPQGRAVLKVYAEYADRGEAPSIRQLAEAIGRSVPTAMAAVRVLRQRGLLAPAEGASPTAAGRNRLTALGLAVHTGLVKASSPWRANRPKRPSAPRGKPTVAKAPPAKPPRPAVTSAPKPAPRPRELAGDLAPRYVRSLEASARPATPPPVAPAPSSVVAPPPPAATGPLATFRGIRHPAPPGPGVRPVGMTDAKWRALTAPPTLAIHSAVMRGTA